MKIDSEKELKSLLEKIVSGEFDDKPDTIDQILDDCIEWIEKHGLVEKYQKANSLIHIALDYRSQLLGEEYKILINSLGI